jgi:hypothetical protein
MRIISEEPWEGPMKYVVSWTYKAGGSAQANEASVARNLDVFSKWAVPDSMTFLQFLTYADNMGGVAVIETDRLEDIALTTAKFTPYADFEVRPALDIEPGVAILNEAIQFRDSIG